MRMFLLTALAALWVSSVLAQWQVEPPTTADPNTPSDCTLWHVAASGDSCQSIPRTYFIDEAQFRSFNPTLATSCNLITGNSYCVERNWGIPPEVTTTSTTRTSTSSAPTSTGNGVATPTPTQSGMATNCNRFYFVRAGDGCADIASQHGIPLSSFYAWNPAVGTTCQGLWPDVYVCVGLIGSTPTPGTTTTRPTNGIATPTPTQSGMVGNCNRFYFVKAGDGCADIASQHGIPLSSFYTWNPAVGSSCQGLWPDVYACVGVIGSTPTMTSSTSTRPGNGITTPTPTQSGMATNCDRFYFVKSGDGCANIASQHGIPLSSFYAWNPAVGTNCQGLWSDVYVCVRIIGFTSTPTTTRPGNGIATPTPTQAGMTPNCNRFHKVVGGDTCFDIANNSGISLSNFYSWNSGVGNNCQTLWADYYVCTRVI